MDFILLGKWVQEIDNVENFSALSPFKNLKLINFVIFPPNTTSKSQSMDQCVIRFLKASYRVSSVCKLIKAVSKINLFLEFPNWTLCAMKMRFMEWESNPKQVNGFFVVFFRKKDFLKTNQKVPFGITMIPLKSQKQAFQNTNRKLPFGMTMTLLKFSITS